MPKAGNWRNWWPKGRWSRRQRRKHWRFDGTALRRARAALRVSRDLQLSAADTAFVMDLLDQIESLKARLNRLGAL